MKRITAVATSTPIKKVTLSPETKSIVKKLSLLFGMDSFAGGFVIHSWVAYWFFAKFAVPENEIANIFFIAGIVTTISYMLAAKIANKIGLVKTMVFTHIPANMLLIPFALVPSLHLAIAFFLVRSYFLSTGEKKDSDSMELVQDPNCGLYLPRDEAVQSLVGDITYCFCSEKCAEEYPSKKS